MCSTYRTRRHSRYFSILPVLPGDAGRFKEEVFACCE
jgi:hypothetical protein